MVAPSTMLLAILTISEMLEIARENGMTDAEIEAQRRSWVIGEMRLAIPALTAEQASAAYEVAIRQRDIERKLA